MASKFYEQLLFPDFFSSFTEEAIKKSVPVVQKKKKNHNFCYYLQFILMFFVLCDVCTINIYLF